MLDNQTFNTTAYMRIVDGMTVYASDGEKLGSVRNYVPQSGFVDVHKGWLFTKDFYVPLGEVDTVAEDGVTLKLNKDELGADRYNMPPTPTAATSEPVTLADGSVMSAGADKQPFDADDADTMQQPKTGDTDADTLRAEQPFRAR